MNVLAESVAAANEEWVRLARPIVKAWAMVDEARLGLNSAWITGTKSEQYVMDEAKGHIRKAYDALDGMLSGIRDNAYCDHCKSGLSEMTDEQWDEVEAFNDALRAGILSVDAVIKLVEAEDE